MHPALFRKYFNQPGGLAKRDMMASISGASSSNAEPPAPSTPGPNSLPPPANKKGSKAPTLTKQANSKLTALNNKVSEVRVLKSEVNVNKTLSLGFRI